MYADLNLSAELLTRSSQSETTSCLNIVNELGYSVIAWNRKAELPLKPSDAKNFRLPPTDHLETRFQTQLLRPKRSSSKAASSPGTFRSHVRQYSRITIVQEDSNNFNHLKAGNPITSTYDIVAVQPESERVFQALCETEDVDMISLTVCRRLPFPIRKAWVDKALKRGIVFEIAYSQAIADSTARRYLISNATTLMKLTKGRNIVFSSGADRALFIRGPYDVMNLAVMLSLSQQAARLTLTSCCQAVLLRSENRKSFSTGVRLETEGSRSGAPSSDVTEAVGVKRPLTKEQPSSNSKQELPPSKKAKKTKKKKKPLTST